MVEGKRKLMEIKDCLFVGSLEEEELLFETVVRAYAATGNIASGKVGQADSHLIDAAELIGFALA